MFTSLFLAPIWIWTSLFAAAVLIPILVHLINLWRYRRVRWAAMEFLLRGYRKKQKKVWLTQLLLIINRMALLLLALIFFGQIRCNVDDNRSLTRGMVHLLIVDDSASMGQRMISKSDTVQSNSTPEITNCLERAKLAVSTLARELSEQPGQKLIVLRTSMDSVSSQTPVPCDSNMETYIDNVFAEPVSDHAIAIWDWMAQNAEQFPKAERVYLVSDFRSADLESDNADRVRKVFPDLTLVECVQAGEGSGNLSLSSMTPEHRLVAAGVPFYLVLEVTNHSDVVKRNTKILVRKSNPLTGGSLEFAEDTNLLIPELPPKKSVQLQVPLLANQSGTIVIEAELPADDLVADNVFHQLIDVQISSQVLLISDNDNPSARFLSWLFEPSHSGSSVENSGFQTEILPPRKVIQESVSLSKYQLIFLLSDDLSNAALVSKLEAFVQQGGLLFFIPGQFADVDLINRMLSKDGTGMLKFRFAAEVELPDRSASQKSDIQFLEEEIKQSFEGDSKKLLEMIQFYRKFVPPRDTPWKDWQFEDDQIEVLASIRGRATTPLITRSSFGNGNVICFLSPFDDRWNNWATNPTFLVLIYRLAYQYSPFRQVENYAGQPWTGFENGENELNGKFRQSNRLADWDSATEVDIPNLNQWKIPARGISRVKRGNQTRWLTARVDPAESNLDLTDGAKLLERTSLNNSNLKLWNDLGTVTGQQGNFYQGIWWLTLALLLGIEQWLAYLLGFHGRQRSNTHVETGSITQRRLHG